MAIASGCSDRAIALFWGCPCRDVERCDRKAQAFAGLQLQSASKLVEPVSGIC